MVRFWLPASMREITDWVVPTALANSAGYAVRLRFKVFPMILDNIQVRLSEVDGLNKRTSGERE